MFKQNGGQSSARNFGVRHSRGDLIALLDQDDAWYPSHLAELVKPFGQRRTKPLGWTYSNLDEVDRNGLLVATAVLNDSGSEHPKTNIAGALGHDMFILPSASVISRRAFESVGGFDERLRGYEDDDLFLRMLRAGYDNVYLPAPLSRWRVFPESSSFSPRMAASRMIFARKLIGSYPDDNTRNLFYARDLIVPRFLHHVAENLRRALRNGDLALAEKCRTDLAELQHLIPEPDRKGLYRPNLLVTAVLALRDGAPTVARTLHSVLGQTHRPDEVLVIDCGSVDNGLEIVRSLAHDYPVRFIENAAKDHSAAKNLGVRHAHGDLIAFVDQGVEWHPDHLAELLKPFADRKSFLLGWSYSDFDETDLQGKLTAHAVLAKAGASFPTATIDDVLQRGLPVNASASLISKAAFEAVGGFDPRLTVYQEDDLFVRLMQQGFENVFVARPLSRRPEKPAVAAAPGAAESRMVFAHKLIKAFGGDPASDKSRMRDLIASRLVPDVLADIRAAMTSGDETVIQAYLAQLAVFDKYLSRQGGSALCVRQPLISVIIPVYNGAIYIREAIESVFTQTLPPDEVIVIDDGSDDNSLEVLRQLALDYPMRIIQRENGGQSAARNTGVEYAHGDLLAFLDQDDIWLPNHLAELVKPFQNATHTRLGWTYSDLDEVEESGDVVCRGFIRCHHRSAHPKLDLINYVGQDMFILPSAALISRDAFQEVGGFNERLSGYEDDDLFLRLFRAGFESVFLPDSLSKWRIHQSSCSYSPRMAVSRFAYAQMLIDRYPNQPARSRYYVRDLIAPRFFRSMAADLRRCVLVGDKQQQKVALDHLAFIVRHLRSRSRLPLRYAVIPLLRVPIVRRLAVARRLPVWRLFCGI